MSLIKRDKKNSQKDLIMRDGGSITFTNLSLRKSWFMFST